MPETKPIRLGIVGCGAVVREYHMPAILAMPQLDTRVLCDKLQSNTGQLKQQFNLAAEVTDQTSDLFGKVDAALVAVPPRFHAPVAIELLEHGIDVLCEKPLAHNVRDAEQMVRVAAQHKRILAVGHMTRFFAQNEILRRLVRDSLLGTITEVIAEYGAPQDWPITSPAYYDVKNVGGGVFFDAGIHVLDRMVWLFGNLSHLEFEDDSYGGYETNAVLRGRLKIAGNEAAFRIAISSAYLLDNSIRVIGTEGTAEARHGDPDAVYVKRRIGGETAEMRVSDPKLLSHPVVTEVFRTQLKNFCDAVQHRRPPLVPADSCLEALRVVEQAYTVRKRMAQPWVEA